jgi:tetratricopeptide (TPR) repeat protein
MYMRKVICLFLTMVFASALVITDTGCTAKVKRAYHLQRANRYFDSAQYDKAEVEYMNVLQHDQLNVQAISRLGIIYFEQGRLTQAAPFLRRGTQLATNDLDLHLKWGMICLAFGKTKDAWDQANYVLDKNPTNDEAPVLLAQSAATKNQFDASRLRLQKLAQTGDRASIETGLGTLSFRERDFKTAEATFKRAQALDPKSSSAYAAMGALYWFQNDLKQADAALKTAFDLSPNKPERQLQYAQFKRKTGDLTAAKNISEQMVKAAPDYVPAWMELADIAAAQTNYDDSAVFLGKVLARDPNNYDAMSLDAGLKLAHGQTADATAEFERMTKIYSQAPLVYYKLALSYLANNDIQKVISSLNQAVVLDTNYSDAIFLLAQIQIKTGDLNPAIALLKRLIQQQPQIPQAQLLLADAFRNQGNFDNALAVYQGLEKTYPTNSQIPLLMGSTYLQQKNNVEARKDFARTLELDPDNVLAIEQLVNLDVSEKQYPAALQRAQQYVDRNPKLAEPLLILAKVFIAQEDNQQAEAALLKAIELQPEFQNAYLILAQVYSNSKQYEKALAEVTNLITKNPKNTAALMLDGMIHNDEKDYKSAADAYEKLLAVDPKSSMALNNLAYLYSDKLGRLDQANNLALQARVLLPNDPYTADTLGWVTYKRGQYTSALALLQESAGKLPAETEVQYHFGMVNYMLGQEESARAAFQSAIQSGKDFTGRDECILCLSLLAIDPKTADDTALAKLEKRVSDKSDDQIALIRLAAIYQREGAAAKAITTYEAALKINSKNVTTLVNLAQLYSSTDVQKAFGLARDAYKLSPNNDQVASTLGRLAYSTSNYKLAFNLLKQTSQAQPGNPAMQYDYAKAAYNAGNVPEATAAMQTALLIGLPPAQSAEGKQLLEMISLADNPDQAMASIPKIDEILKSHPNYLPALMAMAVINERTNDIPAAQLIYEKVLTPAQYPDFAPAQKRLAILYAKDPNNKEKAYALAIKAREMFPDDSELAKTIAIIVYQQGDYTRATNLLQASVADRSTDPEPLYYLGMAQYHLKKWAECRKNLQSALNLKLPAQLAQEAKRVLVELK